MTLAWLVEWVVPVVCIGVSGGAAYLAGLKAGASASMGEALAEQLLNARARSSEGFVRGWHPDLRAEWEAGHEGRVKAGMYAPRPNPSPGFISQAVSMKDRVSPAERAMSTLRGVKLTDEEAEALRRVVDAALHAPKTSQGGAYPKMGEEGPGEA